MPASHLCVLLSVPLSHPAICPSVLSTHLSFELLELGALDSSAGLSLTSWETIGNHFPYLGLCILICRMGVAEDPTLCVWSS